MPRLLRKLDGEEVLQTGIDVIGDLAIVKFPGVPLSSKRRIAKGLMGEMKNVKGVFEQVGPIEGDYRLRRLLNLAGENRTLTVHHENGCRFKVDIARTYYSPRLSTERLRVAERTQKRERVLNMFAGVGPFSITIAKKSGATVTSCEINEDACRLHLENNSLNKVEARVSVVNADAASLAKLLDGRFDRIVMPLPSRANEYLGVASRLLNDRGAIHYYRHVAGNDLAEAKQELGEELRRLAPSFASEMRRVREVGPRWMELVADLSRARD